MSESSMSDQGSCNKDFNSKAGAPGSSSPSDGLEDLMGLLDAHIPASQEPIPSTSTTEVHVPKTPDSEESKIVDDEADTSIVVSGAASILDAEDELLPDSRASSKLPCAANEEQEPGPSPGASTLPVRSKNVTAVSEASSTEIDHGPTLVGQELPCIPSIETSPPKKAIQVVELSQILSSSPSVQNDIDNIIHNATELSKFERGSPLPFNTPTKPSAMMAKEMKKIGLVDNCTPDIINNGAKTRVNLINISQSSSHRKRRLSASPTPSRPPKRLDSGSTDNHKEKKGRQKRSPSSPQLPKLPDIGSPVYKHSRKKQNGSPPPLPKRPDFEVRDHNEQGGVGPWAHNQDYWRHAAQKEPEDDATEMKVLFSSTSPSNAEPVRVRGRGRHSIEKKAPAVEAPTSPTARPVSTSPPKKRELKSPTTKERFPLPNVAPIQMRREDKKTTGKICFNCGSKEHTFMDCKQCCGKCGENGHRTMDCLVVKRDFGSWARRKP